MRRLTSEALPFATNEHVYLHLCAHNFLLFLFIAGGSCTGYRLVSFGIYHGGHTYPEWLYVYEYAIKVQVCVCVCAATGLRLGTRAVPGSVSAP